jgi:hypothetical protein
MRGGNSDQRQAGLLAGDAVGVYQGVQLRGEYLLDELAARGDSFGSHARICSRWSA